MASSFWKDLMWILVSHDYKGMEWYENRIVNRSLELMMCKVNCLQHLLSAARLAKLLHVGLASLREMLDLLTLAVSPNPPYPKPFSLKLLSAGTFSWIIRICRADLDYTLENP